MRGEFLVCILAEPLGHGAGAGLRHRRVWGLLFLLPALRPAALRERKHGAACIGRRPSGGEEEVEVRAHVRWQRTPLAKLLSVGPSAAGPVRTTQNWRSTARDMHPGPFWEGAERLGYELWC